MPTTVGVPFMKVDPKDLWNAVNTFKAWRHTLKLNHDEVQYAKAQVDVLQTEVESYDLWLQNYRNDEDMKLPYSIAFARLKKCRVYIDEASDRLMRAEEASQKNALKVNQTDIEREIANISPVLDKLSTALENLCGSLDKMRDEWKASIQSETEREHFIPDTFTVPHCHSNLTLDFESTDKNDDPLTNEGKLLKAILHDRVGSTIGPVAYGEGGVGKTCALIAVGHHQKTKNRFPDGILYLSLGAEDGPLNLLENLSGIVEESGGHATARRLRNEGADDLSKAFKIASEWFRGRTCLFLVDDLCMRENIDASILDQFYKLIRGGSSKICYTTRDNRFIGDALVTFDRITDTEQAGKFLCHAAKLGFPNGRDARFAFHRILGQCSGLPLALSLSGGAVKTIANRRSEDLKEEAWIEYRDLATVSKFASEKARMERQLEVALEVQGGNQCRKHFLSLCVLRKQQRIPSYVLKRLWNLQNDNAVCETLDWMESLNLLRISEEGGNRFGDVHDLILDICRDMAIREKQFEGFNYSLITSYLEDVCDERAPSLQTEEATDCSALEEEIGVRRGFFQRLCDCFPSKTTPNRRSLSSDSKQSDSEQQAEPSPMRWLENFQSLWLSVQDDSFIFRNICGLLENAGLVGDLIWLLCQPSWMVKRVNPNDGRHVEADIDMGLKCVDGDDFYPADKRAQLETFLKFLRTAVHLSSQAAECSNWDGTLWFQLYARLRSIAHSNDEAKHFVEAIRSKAPRPWARPSIGCLPCAGGPLRDVYKVDGSIICTHEVDNVLLICYRNNTNIGVKSIDMATASDLQDTIVDQLGFQEFKCGAFSGSGDILTAGTRLGEVKIWKRKTSGSHFNPSSFAQGPNCTAAVWGWRGEEQEDYECDVHYVWPCCVAISENGGRVAFKSDRGTVRVLEKEGGVWKPSNALESHTGEVNSEVNCVAISADGGRVVFGGEDCKARLWGKKGGVWKMVGVLQGHTRPVQSLAICAEGGRVVSGSSDCDVRLWQEHGGVLKTFSILQGHTKLVEHVAISRDGRRVVSGSVDGKAMLWEEEGGVLKATGELESLTVPLAGVTICTSSRRVVCASVDGTATVLEEEDGVWKTHRVQKGHTRLVTSVAISREGGRVVSGSADDTARVWEQQGGEWKMTGVLEGHKSGVTSVAISTDGGRVVSGSLDTMVRIWEQEDGEWKTTDVLEGHKRWVTSVAVSADGGRVISESGDRTVRVWKQENGEWKTTGALESYTKGAISATLSTDGGRVVFGSVNDTARVGEGFGSGWADVTEEEDVVAEKEFRDCDVWMPAKHAILEIGGRWKCYWTPSTCVVTLYRPPYIVFLDRVVN